MNIGILPKALREGKRKRAPRREHQLLEAPDLLAPTSGCPESSQYWEQGFLLPPEDISATHSVLVLLVARKKGFLHPVGLQLLGWGEGHQQPPQLMTGPNFRR